MFNFNQCFVVLVFNLVFMDEDDFLLDEEDEDTYLSPEEITDSDDDDGLGDLEEDDSAKLDTSLYKGKLSDDELWFITAYNDVAKCKEIEEAATIIVLANPQHTSTNTVAQIIKDMFHKQGHSRMQNTKYQQGPLRGEDMKGIVDDENDDVDIEVNNELMEEIKSMVNGFVEYLATRDLSEDSITSRRRKQRQLPAFIIFMFSSGIYDFIIGCPSMPAEYQEQISFALKKINQAKYDILEEMAKRYDEAGRPEVAQKARDMGLSWFYREPAEVRTAAEYRDLNLTAEDIDIYREFRPKYTNLTSALTQDVISDYIEVVIDPKKGIYEKLKDKTRSEAINDVKRVFKEWATQYQPENSGLADKLIFKNI